MKKFISTFLLCISPFLFLFTQEAPAWDNTAKGNWHPAFKKVDIPSTRDGVIQKAYMYGTTCKTPQPLIISLHTWSGNFTQKDPLTKEIMARDWNYIHPDFRGANKKPGTMGSPEALADIEDAIEYALKHTNADPSDVHIIGVSGGGFATLAAYMNVDYPVKSFSAWVPISDIEAWYWESVGRNSRYAKDILNVVSTDGKTFDREIPAQNSPLRQEYPIEKRKDARLFIYTGVHDGYKGSVPITQSLNMYNRLVGELKYGISDMDEIMLKAVNDSHLVSPKEMLELLGKRMNPDFEKNGKLFGREIHLMRKYKNIQLIVFEGKHEQIPQALGLVPCNKVKSLSYNILTIGDSNGQKKDGWVVQLKKMLPESTVVNISEAGRAIGFDNNNKERLNALRNIDSYLEQAQMEKKKYDYIIVCLGTNDTKKMFKDKQGEVPKNFERLLDRIKGHRLCKGPKTKLIFVTPPPLREENISSKYQGSNERLNLLMPELISVAVNRGFKVVDVYHPLLGILDYYAADGVHMAGAGQEIIASQIINAMSE
ncbi:SGNH/GDSL hydrolase family protein [uncultured Bacteroides sp.]|uniref:SGNH/GDSL hydrolase family protein n=1 Tax=uncultured Bacteroides sp. TaxID=162156 RepID=UPI0025DCD81D|nr:SGNH/GDSL hydrolase family protein [uncultured Bacteroides sp.]